MFARRAVLLIPPHYSRTRKSAALSPLFTQISQPPSANSFPCASFQKTPGGWGHVFQTQSFSIRCSLPRFSSFDLQLSTFNLFLPLSPSSAPPREAASRPYRPTVHQPDKSANDTSLANAFPSIACGHFPSLIGGGGRTTPNSSSSTSTPPRLFGRGCARVSRRMCLRRTYGAQYKRGSRTPKRGGLSKCNARGN